MTRRLLPLLAVVSLGCFAMTAGTLRAADDAAVRQANDQFYAALNKIFVGDMAPMAEVWSHAADVTYLPPDKKFLVGWDAVKADWKVQADAKYGGQVQPADVHIVVGESLAVVQNWERGTNTPDGGEVQKVSIRATNVYRLEDGTWKMISHMADPLPFVK